MEMVRILVVWLFCGIPELYRLYIYSSTTISVLACGACTGVYYRVKMEYKLEAEN